MRNSEIIDFDGAEITVKEITLAELDNMLTDAESLNSHLDRMFAQEGVSASMITSATGMDAATLSNCTPSTLRPIITAIKKVNSDFFLMVKAEEKKTQEIGQMLRDARENKISLGNV